MRVYVDYCCDCDGTYGHSCAGCNLRNVEEVRCDECRTNEDIYAYGEQELCYDCLKKLLIAEWTKNNCVEREEDMDDYDYECAIEYEVEKFIDTEVERVRLYV